MYIRRTYCILCWLVKLSTAILKNPKSLRSTSFTLIASFNNNCEKKEKREKKKIESREDNILFKPSKLFCNKTANHNFHTGHDYHIKHN
jgi:hypothetical protein